MNSGLGNGLGRSGEAPAKASVQCWEARSFHACPSSQNQPGAQTPKPDLDVQEVQGGLLGYMPDGPQRPLHLIRLCQPEEVPPGLFPGKKQTGKEYSNHWLEDWFAPTPGASVAQSVWKRLLSSLHRNPRNHRGRWAGKLSPPLLPQLGICRSNAARFQKGVGWQHCPRRAKTPDQSEESSQLRNVSVDPSVLSLFSPSMLASHVLHVSQHFPSLRFKANIRLSISKQTLH